ncbi:MAG: T9SS type A sorting domain-containing protein [Ignavibacteria bacterium]
MMKYFFLSFLLFYNYTIPQNNFVVFNLMNAPFPTNKPFNIVQDKDGSYWFSFFSEKRNGINYPGGIARFDGSTWQVFTNQNSPLPTKSVNVIAIDSLGRKWIGTDSGLVKYDGMNWIIYTKDNSPLMEDIIWNVTVERDTIIWIASYTTGLYRFDGINWNRWHTDNSPLISNQINFILIDDAGIKWIGADYSPLFSFDGTNWQIHGKFPFAPGPGGFANPDVRSMAIDKYNTKWISGAGYWGAGLPRWYAIAKFIDTTWTFYDSTVIGFQHYSNYCGVAIDKNNIKWFTDFRNGLIRYDDTTFYLFNQENSPISNSWAIIVDKFNNKVFSAELNEQLPDGTYLRGIVFYNENGVVLSSADNDSPKPFDFYLAQNYPNPFNEKTKISWHSPVSGHQTIKVYDVLGREIATLVDEYRNPGIYEVTFNAENLPSGIYLYKFSTGLHSLTKKMLLIK